MTLDSKKIQDINLAYFFFNLTVAKELTPNPGGVYIQDRDIPSGTGNCPGMRHLIGR